MEQLQNVENNDVEVMNNVLEDDFYYDGDVEKETLVSEETPLEEIKMDDINLEERELLDILDKNPKLKNYVLSMKDE